MHRESNRRIATWIGRAALLGLVSLIAFAATVLVLVPRATHGVALTVLTGSMTPKIPVGSVVVDRPVDPGTLKVGDIATYQKVAGKAEYVTHRIIKIDTSKSPVLFTFKGDANRGPDALPVPATAIRGKVWFHLPYLGALREGLRTKGGVSGVAMLLLLAYAVSQLVGARKSRTISRADRPEPAASFIAVTNDRVLVMATLPMPADLSSVADIRRLVGQHLLETSDEFVRVIADDDETDDAHWRNSPCSSPAVDRLRRCHLSVADAEPASV